MALRPAAAVSVGVNVVTWSISAPKLQDKFSKYFVTTSGIPLWQCVQDLVCIDSLVLILRQFAVFPIMRNRDYLTWALLENKQVDVPMFLKVCRLQVSTKLSLQATQEVCRIFKMAVIRL